LAPAAAAPEAAAAGAKAAAPDAAAAGAKAAAPEAAAAGAKAAAPGTSGGGGAAGAVAEAKEVDGKKKEDAVPRQTKPGHPGFEVVILTAAEVRAVAEPKDNGIGPMAGDNELPPLIKDASPPRGRGAGRAGGAKSARAAQENPDEVRTSDDRPARRVASSRGLPRAADNNSTALAMLRAGGNHAAAARECFADDGRSESRERKGKVELPDTWGFILCWCRCSVVH